MREAKLEPSVILPTMPGIAACEKGEQWQRALALLSKMREAEVGPDVISYIAAADACGRGGQWQQALLLLRGAAAARPERHVLLERALSRATAGAAAAAADLGQGAREAAPGGAAEPVAQRRSRIIAFAIPVGAVGRVLAVAAAIQRASGAGVSVESNRLEAEVTVSGSLEAVHRAHRLIIGRVLAARQGGGQPQP
ncbi:unnamed protein product [Prorocentrum cordatum]|uniref:Uncharacterized protein n=1 Tax=Prorocentrum cordatum TaxID=2364126 RepID=A0ABN9W7H2_9DINO|nr:unnamed protein product [Polarella glacialis]